MEYQASSLTDCERNKILLRIKGKHWKKRLGECVANLPQSHSYN